MDLLLLVQVLDTGGKGCSKVGLVSPLLCW